ncbi:uncharacterized protein LOC114322285 [Camellia sinensis]|uniref:uncharacterized protein LOC114322285 n=1 Tax=Camellia sinensis TaxID=4442 RepID=UPI001035BF8A|nr:uncharacterized protein LOC114322285 [Camellia sinensis]
MGFAHHDYSVQESCSRVKILDSSVRRLERMNFSGLIICRNKFRHCKKEIFLVMLVQRRPILSFVMLEFFILVFLEGWCGHKCIVGSVQFSIVYLLVVAICCIYVMCCADPQEA